MREAREHSWSEVLGTPSTLAAEDECAYEGNGEP